MFTPTVRSPRSIAEEKVDGLAGEPNDYDPVAGAPKNVGLELGSEGKILANPVNPPEQPAPWAQRK